MKILLPILVLSLAVLSCRFGSNLNSSSTDKPATSPSPSVPKKVFDVPSMLGKSPDEVKKLLGPPKDEFGSDKTSPSLEYEFIQGHGRIDFKKGKLDNIIFITDGFLFDTPEQFANLFGIDLRGKTPTNIYDFGTIYENLTINGVKVAKLSFSPMGGQKGFSNFQLDMD